MTTQSLGRSAVGRVHNVRATAASSQNLERGKGSKDSRRNVLRLQPHKISLADGKTFALNLPEGFDITVAAEGLKRVRFMARSPDDRIFVTDMYNLTDNERGVVYILDDFDERKGKFGKVTRYLTRLRNPNSIAFYTDRTGTHWLYLALTERLVRYRYAEGDDAPSGAPEVLATFPDYGLSYKYGGWHLTRTVTVGPNDKIYVSVGSSCNACEEKEKIRATVLEMDADGRHQRIFASGLRNAVGIKWVDGRFFVTDMGADHLGENKPHDTMYAVKEGLNYGWPYCYQSGSKVYADAQFNKSAKRVDCKDVPVAYAAFSAHSSPLGLEYFGSDNQSPDLQNSFLVALHGSSEHSLLRGHRIVRVRQGGAVRDFITGFMQGGKVYGRPADVMRLGADRFLFTDDHTGVVYYVFKTERAAR
ncbi:MAG TPA: PQQ-dependent sugar dehydrogenase [Pyrinomonadaceae bacterium]|jgi:glucose/arabinose dehydrogenase